MNNIESNLYTKDFYKEQQQGSRTSAKEIIPLVLDLIQPNSVIDVGCGVGTWLSVFKELGIKNCLGIDGSYVDQTQLLIPQEEFLAWDLKQPINIDKKFDLVISLEVAEHLPQEIAETFVNSLTRLGEVILFSAAPPFQGGTGHLNEQWLSYWLEHFHNQGYIVADCLRKKIWDNDQVEFWYAQNIVIFIKENCLHKYPLIEKEIQKNQEYYCLNLIHPKLYLSKVNTILAIAGKSNFLNDKKIPDGNSTQLNKINLNFQKVALEKHQNHPINCITQKPRIDVVLQATGIHGWSASHGWINTLQREGLLNRVFRPVAGWGAEEPLHDDGLFEYLQNPQADIILMLGFDWHSQPLHTTLKWQERWHQSPIIKIVILQECCSADVVQNTPAWQQQMHQAIMSTIPCVDGLICNHEPDVDFLQQQLSISLPIIFLPFAIDTDFFRINQPFLERLNRGLFRGNAPRYFTEKSYQERQNLIETLSSYHNVDLFSTNLHYDQNPFKIMQDYVEEINAYRIVLNLPSNSPTLTARPFEVLGCGSLLLQNKIIGVQSQSFLKDWEHVVYYDADKPEELIDKIEYLIFNQDLAEKIASQGYILCHNLHTIKCRITTILEWINNDILVKAEIEKTSNIYTKNIFINKSYLTANTDFKVIIDGVFFQLYQTGIARVWRSLLEQWSNSDFVDHILVLDRANTAPQINGIRYRVIPAYDYNDVEADKEMLQQICDDEGAELFISSYYTTPLTTPSVFMAYDMIPEVMGWNMNNPMWQVKHQGIQHASGYIAISEHTARDLAKCFPGIPVESITVAHCGVSSTFSPSKSEEIHTFKMKYGITKPYFILVGAGNGYKNSMLFFQAFSQFASSSGFDIVCTGSGGILAEEFRACTSGSNVYMLQLSDEELAIAYSGAVALVYPSKYEGFGMPIVEAMACGCPVITCPNASIPEAGGEAVIYVNDDNVDAMVNALCEVQKPSVRRALINAGLAQAQKFSWAKMADIVSSALINASVSSFNLREINVIVFPDWAQSEDVIGVELEAVIKAIATYPDSQKTTLLINTSHITTEDVELLISGITMNLLMAEDLDISEGLEISLLGSLADTQWQVVLPKITTRIILNHEDKAALTPVLLELLPACELESFINKFCVLQS